MSTDPPRIARADYERYLLELEEYGDIERHQEFLIKHFPEYLEKPRRPRVGKTTELIVSDIAKRALKHKWNNPSDEKPSWFVKSQKVKKRKVGRIRGLHILLASPLLPV
ncbi:MAG: hypothetical protein ACMG6H_11240, partial [Acidobacteriota bacterium]